MYVSIFFEKSRVEICAGHMYSCWCIINHSPHQCIKIRSYELLISVTSQKGERDPVVLLEQMFLDFTSSCHVNSRKSTSIKKFFVVMVSMKYIKAPDLSC